MANHQIQELSGKLILNGSDRIAIIASRFNDTIVERLVDGCVDTLMRHGANPENLTLSWVPGAFELPLIAKRWALSGETDAIICLGTVIRGATSHFDYVCGQTANGIARVSLDTEIPVIFGVLTTETIEQAVERSGTKAGNKGIEAAIGAIETLNLIRQIPSKSSSQLSSVLNKT